MRLFRPGFLAQCLYPDALFRIKTAEKILFLTFDDGPSADSTPQLLDILGDYKIPAVFFCNGAAAEKQPDLINRITNAGHHTANHGYSHLNGWRTKAKSYADDIFRGSEFISGNLFRPPYGRLTFKQRHLLKSYKLVFWDIMPYDFDPSFGPKNSLAVLKKLIRPGSIIVLHDSPSSCANDILGEFIEFAHLNGYRFELI